MSCCQLMHFSVSCASTRLFACFGWIAVIETLKGIRLFTWPTSLKFSPLICGWLSNHSTWFRIWLSDWLASNKNNWSIHKQVYLFLHTYKEFHADVFWAVFISPCVSDVSSFWMYCKVDPMKIGNFDSANTDSWNKQRKSCSWNNLLLPESKAGTMKHKTNALSIDQAGKHSQAQIDGGNFKLIGHVTSLIPFKDSRWQWYSMAFFPSSTRPLSDKMWFQVIQYLLPLAHCIHSALFLWINVHSI